MKVNRFSKQNITKVRHSYCHPQARSRQLDGIFCIACHLHICNHYGKLSKDRLVFFLYLYKRSLSSILGLVITYKYKTTRLLTAKQLIRLGPLLSPLVS